jgi:hypothetical protein
VLLVFLAGSLSASSHGAFVVTSKTPGLAAVGTILGDGQRRSGSCVHKRPLALRMNGGSSARESRTLSKNECGDPIHPARGREARRLGDASGSHPPLVLAALLPR